MVSKSFKESGRPTKLPSMEQTHVLRMVRGLTSTEVRCDDCAYAYVDVVQDRTMTHLAGRRWIDHGDPDVIHIAARQQHPTTRSA